MLEMYINYLLRNCLD